MKKNRWRIWVSVGVCSFAIIFLIPLFFSLGRHFLFQTQTGRAFMKLWFASVCVFLSCFAYLCKQVEAVLSPFSMFQGTSACTEAHCPPHWNLLNLSAFAAVFRLHFRISLLMNRYWIIVDSRRSFSRRHNKCSIRVKLQRAVRALWRSRVPHSSKSFRQEVALPRRHRYYLHHQPRRGAPRPVQRHRARSAATDGFCVHPDWSLWHSETAIRANTRM